MQTMKPVVTRLYAVLVALTFVGLFAWAGADWYQLQQKALGSDRAELRQAAGWISELTVRRLPLDTANLGRVFAPVLTDGRWRMLVLSSPDRGTEFYKGPRPPAPVDQVVPRWEAKPFSEVKVSIPVFRATGDPLVLEGIAEFYGPSEVFTLLKACGFTLAALLILTTIMVILSSRSTLEDDEREVRDQPLPREPQTQPSAGGKEPSQEAAKAPRQDEHRFDDKPFVENLPPLDHPAEDVPKQAPPGAEPSLFSPETGLGWEAFLTTRLASELDRAASQNQDLTVVLLSAKDGAIPAGWGEAVRKAFPWQDLNFEHGNGAAVILPGRSLEQALKAARAFVEVNEGQITVCAGVAARSGRLLSATTLLNEAGSALRRSLTGTARVLGLKTDAERYREHLASASA